MTALLSVVPLLAAMLVLIGLERRARAPRTDWAVNLQAWFLNAAVGATVLLAIPRWHGPSLIEVGSLPGWAAILVFLVVWDFGEYLFHRAQHRLPVLWAMHSLHHSDPEMSALTTQRHFWGDPLLKSVTIWLASATVIAPTPELVAAYNLFSLWNLFVHSRLEVNLGRWSWLINSPAYHRRHHSSLPEHYDGNFAALFPLWDVLCGTYHRPDGFPPTGLDTRPRTLGELAAWPLVYARRTATARRVRAAQPAS